MIDGDDKGNVDDMIDGVVSHVITREVTDNNVSTVVIIIS